MSEFSPEYLKGWKDSVEAEQISGDRVTVLSFGVLAGFIIGMILLWTGRKRFDAKDLEVIDPDADAKKKDREAAALAAMEEKAACDADHKEEPAPAPKPSDLGEQAS